MDDKILNIIAALLAQAEHPNTSEIERDTFLAKADAMMAKHMIDEALVRMAQKPDERRKPVRVDVKLYDYGTTFGNRMRVIAAQLFKTVGVRAAYSHRTGESTLVGFEEDVKWAQLLFMNIQTSFLAKMTPKWDPQRSFDDNVAALRESGAKWDYIARTAERHEQLGVPYGSLPGWDDKGREKVQDMLVTAYRRWCRKTGSTPVKVTRHEAYRHSYAEAFTARVCARLEEMAEARREAGSGMELVLYNVQEAVDAAFYEAFPDLDPEAQKARMEAIREQQRQADEAHAAWLASLTPAQRLRYEREQAAKREKEMRENDRYWRQQDKKLDSLYDSNGRQAGRAAADSVNLSTAESASSAQKPELS